MPTQLVLMLNWSSSINLQTFRFEQPGVPINRRANKRTPLYGLLPRWLLLIFDAVRGVIGPVEERAAYQQFLPVDAETCIYIPVKYQRISKPKQILLPINFFACIGRGEWLRPEHSVNQRQAEKREMRVPTKPICCRVVATGEKPRAEEFDPLRC